ncbi:MAG: phage major capsid protein [Clostridia bacterium]|nr:phage major capsid protein [Clostridia bacterium]
MLTLNNAENALKTIYLGAVTDLLNVKTNPLLSKIEQTTSDVWGKEIRKAAKFGINGGIGAGDEDGNLPAPHSSEYVQFVTTLKNLYGQIEISDKAIRASQDGRGVFTDLLNSELEDLLNASKFNLGRMLYGDGTGRLGVFKTTDVNPCYVSNVQNFTEGLVVDIYTTAGVMVDSGLVVTKVDRQEKTVTFNREPQGMAINNGIYVQGSKGKEITGLGAIFGSGDLYGLSRDQYKWLTPYNKNVADVLDETMIQEAIDHLEITAGSTVDFISCSADVKYAYQEYMAQYKRNIEMTEINGGFKTMSFNGIPLVYDRFVGEGTMYLLDTSCFHLHQLCDWRFLESENGKILRQTQGKPTYTATLVKYCDLICDKPNGQGRLINIMRA